MPFDWYTLNLGDFLFWLGSVMQSLYYVWQALWTRISELPNVGTVEWNSFLLDLWEVLFDGMFPFVGQLTPIEFLLGSYLVIIIVVALVKAIKALFKP